MRNKDYDSATAGEKKLWEVYVSKILPITHGMSTQGFLLEVQRRHVRKESVKFEDLFNNSDEAFALGVMDKKKVMVYQPKNTIRSGAPKQNRSTSTTLTLNHFVFVHNRMIREHSNRNSNKLQWYAVLDEFVKNWLKNPQWQLHKNKDSESSGSAEDLMECPELDEIADDLDEADLKVEPPPPIAGVHFKVFQPNPNGIPTVGV